MHKAENYLYFLFYYFQFQGYNSLLECDFATLENIADILYLTGGQSIH